jgi:DNA-binding transcriptional LysR family regulator
MDRFDAMSVLLAVVEKGSFSAASRELRMPLPTVSRKISELEAHVHARLLTRSTRKLALTDAGRDYVAACKRILQDLSDAERAAAGEYSAPRGDLVISAPIVFGRMYLQPVVNEFLGAYPEVDVRIVFGDRIINFHEEHIDVAVRIGALPDSSLIATRVGQIRLVVCASPDYFVRRGTPQTPSDLAGHDCISFEGLVSARAWTFGAHAHGEPVPVRSRLVVNTADAAIDAARAGVGIARALSYQVEPACRSGELMIVLEPYEPEPRPVSLIYPGQGRMPLKLRAFLDFATPRLKARLPYGGA